MKKWTLAFIFIAFTVTTKAQQVIPFKDANNKWGVKNNGTVVVTPQYDFLDNFSGGVAVAFQGTQYGVIDTSGKIVVPFGKYGIISKFSEGLAAATVQKKYGFIDTSGNEIIAPQYEYAESFAEGLAMVQYNNLAGFINKAGKVVVPFKYGYGRQFEDGVAVVGIGGEWDIDDYILGKYGIVDKNGKEIVPVKYDYIGYFSGGIAEVNTGGKWEYDEYDMPDVYGGLWGVIDKTGKEIIPLKYDYVMTDSFAKYGYIVVETNKKFGVVNAAGVLIAPARYDFIKPSSTEAGIAVVNIGGKYNEVFSDLAFNPYGGGSQGFINYKTGKEITPVQYANVSDFNEGIAMVNMGAVYDGAGYKGGKWGYIDTNGKTIIPLKFDTADYFFSGKAKVSLNGREFYIDKTGKEIQ